MSGRTASTLTAFAAAAMGIWSIAARWADAPVPAKDTLFFALHIQGEDGATLAQPMLVGEDGKRLRVHLQDPARPGRDRLSLVLDPTVRGGDLEVGLELTLPGEPAGKSTVQIPLGAETTFEIGKVSFALYAARVPSEAFERYLRARRAGPPTT
jgi:hypothetical protein